MIVSIAQRGEVTSLWQAYRKGDKYILSLNEMSNIYRNIQLQLYMDISPQAASIEILDIRFVYFILVTMHVCI